MGFLSDIQEKATSFLGFIKSEEGEQKEFLPEDLQNYATDLSKTLKGDTAAPVVTIEELNALDRESSIQLLQDAEEGYDKNTIESIVSGTGNISTVQNDAMKLAALNLEANSESGIPAASAISASLQDSAEALVDNPELEALPLQDRQRYEEVNTKYDAAIYTVNTMPESSTWSKAKSIGNKIVPIPGFIDQRTYQDLLKSVGLKDATKWSTAENIMQFRGFLMKILQHPEVSAADVPLILNKLREDMLTAGGNSEDIKDLFTKTIVDYDPASETFNDYVDVLAAVPVTKAVAGIGKAAVVGKAAIKTAAKGVAEAAVEYLNPIPGTDTLVKKGLNQAVKGTVNATDKVGKALRSKNRVKAANAVIDAIGEPTETVNPFRVKDTKTFYERGLDSAIKPEEFMEPSVANDAYVFSSKMDKALESKIELIKNTVSNIKDLKAKSWIEAAQAIENTLKMEDVVGVGKAGIGDLVKAYQEGNVQMSREGNLIATITAQKSFDSVLVNGIDEGLKKAQELGKALSGNYKGIGVGYSVEKNAGKWYTKVNIDTKQGWGNITNNYLLGSEKNPEKWSPYLSSIFTVTSNPEDIRMLNVLRNIDANVLSSSGEASVKAYNSLSNKDKKLLQAIADAELRYESWYSNEHLLSRGVSQNVVDAHEAFRVMNDLDAYVLNVAKRDELVSKGAKQISFNGEFIEGVGRVVPVADASEFKRILKGSDGKAKRDIMFNTVRGDVVSVESFSDQMLDSLFSKGYKIIEGSLSPDIDNFKASSFYYLLNAEQTVVNELGEFVSTYVAGGRRFFDRDGGFLKQLKMGKTATGRRAITGVNTLAADKDFIGLTRRGEVLESIRKAACKKDDFAGNKLISEAKLSKAPFTNMDEFVEWAKDNGIDIENIENALEVTKNGHLLSSYNTLLKNKDVDDFVGLETMNNIAHRSHFQALTQEAKQARARRTGKELFNFDFDTAQPVDIEQQMRYIVNDMVYGGVMKDFTEIYADRFAKLYKGIVTVPGVTNPSPVELLLNGKVSTSLDGAEATLAASAETAIKNYAAIRGVPTDFDVVIARNATALFNWIGGCAEDVLKLNEDIAHKARLDWQKFVDKDPAGYARAFTSHWFLGWCNISQIYKQASADAYVALMEPRAALSAAKWSFPFASALRKSDGSIEKAMEKLATKFGDAPEAVKADFESLVRMGVFEHGVGGGLVEAKQTTKSLLNKISMAPFNVGEMHNRTFAYLTALHSLGYSGQKLTTAQLAEVATKGQRLFLNMDATGLSRLQTSTIGKTLLQFMGFRMRWFETILFDKGLTRTQRARLALGTAALVGGEGMLGVSAYSGLCNVFNNYFGNKDEGSAEDRSELARLFARGALNYFSEESGLDTDLAASLNIDAEEFFDKIFGLSLLDLPSVASIGSAYNGLIRGATILKESVTGELTADKFEAHLEVIARQKELPSSASRAILSALFWKNGKDFNSKGQLTERSNSVLRKVLHTLGFNSLTQKDAAKAFSELAYSKDKEKTVIDLCKPFISQYGRGNTDAYKIAAMIVQEAGLTDAQKIKVWKELDTYAYSANNISVTEGLLENQLYKETGTNLIHKARRDYQNSQNKGE